MEISVHIENGALNLLRSWKSVVLRRLAFMEYYQGSSLSCIFIRLLIDLQRSSTFQFELVADSVTVAGVCLINKRDHAYTDRSERTLLSQRVKEKSKGASSLTGYIFNRNTSRRGRSINRITRSMCPILTFFAVSTSETDFAIATITSRQINALSTVLAWFVKTFVYVCTNHKDKVSC